MAEYLGPRDTWPTHSRPEARDALAEAARAGWSFRKSAGHAFGRIACPAQGTPEACMVVIFSTSGPADGSETAKAIRRGLRKCPHHAEPDAAESAEEEVLSEAAIVRRVEHLLEVVDGLEERARADERRDDALARGDDGDFDEADQRLVDADNTAQVAWDALGRPLTPWPPDVAARELLTDAERFAARIAEGALADRLRQSIERRRQ